MDPMTGELGHRGYTTDGGDTKAYSDAASNSGMHRWTDIDGRGL
jgi:hypothetical protein